MSALDPPFKAVGEEPPGCPFCELTKPRRPGVEKPFLAHYGDVVVFEPLKPVCEGHVLVVPVEHVANAVEKPTLSGRVIEAAACYVRNAGVGPCNLITSVGSPATQTVFHLHLHIVPRAFGDGLALPWTGQR